jgi:GMP synthase (glutamine-hydrolysing)
MAWQQDQVIEPPADATTICSTGFCRHAALKYGNKALTIQPHPEFTKAYFNDLLEVRKSILPESVVQAASRSADQDSIDDHVMADMITAFFKDNEHA